MLATLHLPQLRQLRRWPVLERRATIVSAAVTFAAVFVLRLTDANVGDGEGALFLIPIGILALRFGLRGALAGMLVAWALVLVWGQVGDGVNLAPKAYVIRFAALGMVAVLMGSFVDHRRRLEAGILRYYEASPDLLATGEPGGRLTRVNPAWERALGYSTEMLYSSAFLHFIHPEDRAATLAEMQHLSTSGDQTTGFRNRFLAADGSYRWLEWNVAIPNQDTVHAVARDVTAQHEAEHQLAENARSLEVKIAQRTRELDHARAETLRQLALAAEYRDDETYQHTERVGHVAARIALSLGLPAGQVTLLRQAAPLHDVGKLAIPDCILLKPGKLTVEEFAVMKTHAELGARLLSSGSSPVLQMAAVIAATHHERWDGTGYPKSLGGEAIPLVGRIVAVADVFDALIHDRPYKAAWPIEDAIAEIERSAGTQFDPRVVQAFAALGEDMATVHEDLDEFARPDDGQGPIGGASVLALPRRATYLEHIDRHAPRAEVG